MLSRWAWSVWDLTTDQNSIDLIQNFWAAKKPVAVVCHAPAPLLNVKDETGAPLVKRKKVTGFTNTEEDAVPLTNVVSFLLEDHLNTKVATILKRGLGF
jgi:putative intracellular protease/amidase